MPPRRNTQSTPSAPPAETRQRYVIFQQAPYQWLRVSPECPELDAALAGRRYVTGDDPTHGYQLQASTESLLSPQVPAPVPVPGTPLFTAVTPNAGLALVADHWLRAHGHDVCLDTSSVVTLRPNVVDDGSTGNPHVISFVASYANGVLSHSLSQRELAILVCEISAAFPETRIACVAASETEAETFAGRLIQQNEAITLALANRCLDLSKKLIVSVPPGLAHTDIQGNPPGIVFCLDAAAAVGERWQLPLVSLGRARLFGLLREGTVMPQSVADRVMAIFGPAEVTVPRLGYARRRVEVAWTRVTGGPALAPDACPYLVQRHGLERNTVRNRRLTALARGLVAGDHGRVQQLCPVIPQNVVSASLSVAVVARTIEQAIDLAHRLPNWAIHTTPDVYLDGLPARDRDLLAARRLPPFGPLRAIITLPALATWDLAPVDVLLWAAGGPGLPDLPTHTLNCPATQERPLLLVDCLDRQHALLGRASRRRRQAYLDAGWFPVGLDPLVGRIERFLARRPGGSA